MKSLSNALEILLEFTDDQQYHSVGDLAAKSGLTKGQISKILSTFRRHGFLQQNPQSRQYSVGMNAYALGSRFVNFHPLSREALPVIRHLVNDTGHSSRLSVLYDGKIIYLLQADGHMLSDTGWRAGMYLPIHATTAGKVALAFLEKADQEAIIENLNMTSLTPKTITDANILLKQLNDITAVGVGLSRSESTPGLGAIGVPVFGPRNTMLAVLSLSFPEHVVSQVDEQQLADTLHDAARSLSQRMGCEAYPFGPHRAR